MMFSYSYLRHGLKSSVAFSMGFCLGQVYYYYLLKQIPFPGQSGVILSLGLSVMLGIGNAICTQLRCIFLLMLPMYCGKSGRGVLKAVILTYIVTGPITNMGRNAKEVVRVFACSTQLTYNLSIAQYDAKLVPLKEATLGVTAEVEKFKVAFGTIADIIKPIELEIEQGREINRTRCENDFMDDIFARTRRSEQIEMEFQSTLNSSTILVNSPSLYEKKLQYRCENQFSRASAVCIEKLTKTYKICCDLMPSYAEHMICWPLNQIYICDFSGMDSNGYFLEVGDICKAPLEPGLADGFNSLKEVNEQFVDRLRFTHLQYKISYDEEALDVQDAKETTYRVQQAFEEKIIVMHHVLTIMNVCVALLFLRVFHAAATYHDLYLTAIDYDNLYVTGYFKRLDSKRKTKMKYFLLPLKKMERNKYIDVHSLSYKAYQRGKLPLQILKVMLEIVTATTFVMLDRLFYEALDVVRQHAEMGVLKQGTRDFQIEVEGTGLIAAMLRKWLDSLNSHKSNHQFTNSACLPHPRQMPYVYFLKIYGGYLWIIILLFANPYTLRLRRLICSYFYSRREKHRVLHLYNDILKKRLKMHKTLRRKAVQAVRAHYLSGETLLSMRMKFPHFFGWLRVLPAARMACLICGDIEPRSDTQSSSRCAWYSCLMSKCPFVYCAECWREVGARCLACEPSLAELSDVDSLTDDEPPQY